MKGGQVMTTRNHLIISILGAFFLLAPSESESAAQAKANPQKDANAARPRTVTETKAKPESNAQKAKPPATKPSTAKPSVSKSAGPASFIVAQDRAGAHIAPLVGVIEGRYIEPPSGESETFSEFVSRYYRAGQKYRLLFGGGEMGTVTVKAGPDKNNECARAQASVELETTAKDRK